MKYDLQNKITPNTLLNFTVFSKQKPLISGCFTSNLAWLLGLFIGLWD